MAALTACPPPRQNAQAARARACRATFHGHVNGRDIHGRNWDARAVMSIGLSRDQERPAQQPLVDRLTSGGLLRDALGERIRWLRGRQLVCHGERVHSSTSAWDLRTIAMLRE